MDKETADSILAPDSKASSTTIAIAKIWMEGYLAGVKDKSEGLHDIE